MRKMILYFCSIFIILLITLLILYLYEKDLDPNIEFLESYGWKVIDKEIETEEIVIPETFDNVYINYNNIQKEAGLDLTPYKGMKAIRYTYQVINYPIKTDENVRANVICINNIPIAGDIMTVSINGFMHSLRYPE